MKRVLFVLVSSFLLVCTSLPVFASIPHGPHDLIHAIDCNSCHPTELSQTDQIAICKDCHDGDPEPLKQSHSSQVITGLPGWSHECLDCHVPHFHDQLSYLSTDSADLFLIKGTISSVASGTPAGKTTVDYVSTFVRDGWNLPPHADLADWGGKSSPGRGMIFIPDRNDPLYAFEVVSSSANQIVLEGEMVSELVSSITDKIAGPGDAEFGILYGQFLRSEVRGPGDQMKVIKFFDPSGGFEDINTDPLPGGFVDERISGTPEGICQVCHTTTDHWVSTAPPVDSHFVAEKCTLCHQHKMGFAPEGPEDGKHESHMAINGVSCDRCHDMADLWDLSRNIKFYDGLLLPGTVVCDSCHNDGAGGGPLLTDFKTGWPNVVYDLDCNGCHLNVPATGSHVLHVTDQNIAAIDCSGCHDGASQDTTQPEQHVDGNIDVYDIVAGDLGYPADKLPVTAYGNCSNSYCHSDGKNVYQSQTWTATPGSLGCDGCHGLLTGTGYPNYINGGPGDVFANSHDTHKQPGSCFYCHDGIVERTGNSIVAGSTEHINTQIDISIHSAFDGGYTYDPVTKTCSNTNCHLADVQWGADPATVTANCGVCHETPPLTGPGINQPHSIHYGIATVPDTYGARNMASTSGSYGFYCGICHPDTLAGHQNDTSAGTIGDPKQMEIDMQVAVGRGGTPNYSTVGATLSTDPGVAEYSPGDPIYYYGYHDGNCTNVYCHSDGKGGPPNILPTWQSGAAPPDCTYCHNNETNLTSGSHSKHLFGLNGAQRRCEECHSLTVSNNRTIIDKTKHVSNYFDAAGDPVNLDVPAVDVAFTVLNSGADPYNATTDTCGNLYCHSDGVGLTFQAPVWAGSIDCNGCHGTSTGDGMPDYVNGTPKANSHSAHVVTAGYSCDVCHFSTTSTGVTITGPANHVDTVFTLQPAGGYTFTYVYNAGGSTCSTISCHFNTGAVWGDVSSVDDCRTCHLDTGDDANYVYNDGTRAKLAGIQWATSGHGRATGIYPISDNLAAGLSCYYCHDDAVDHDVATNPFRLTNISGGDGMNGNCLICHKAGAIGYDSGEGLKNPVVKIDGRHFGADHSGNDGGLFCWDCHDAHGDNNIFMVHDAVSNSSDGVYGIPAVTVTAVFNSDVTGSDYAAVGVGNGICQTCHTTTSYYRADGTGATHYISKCIGCHKHDNDFGYGAVGNTDCESCHGHDSGYEYSPGLFSEGAGTFESHSSHTENDGDDLGGPNLACNSCHVSTYPYFNAGALGLDGNGDTWYELSETSICSQVCHQDGTGGAPSIGDYKNGWSTQGYSLSCNSCHNYPPMYPNGTPKANSHQSHVIVSGYTCNICHVDTTADGNLISGITFHVNGVYDAAPDSGYTFTYDNVGGTCTNISCHGGTDATWGDSSLTVCLDCHSVAQDNLDGIPVGGRRAISGEFPLGDAHAHYGGPEPTSCQVCHASVNHMNGTVTLLDPDDGANFDFILADDLTSDPDLSNFCANCHDADGATRLGTPMDPFGNGNAPPDVATKFQGTLQWNEWYGDQCIGSEGSLRPVNSHHDISDADQLFSGAKLECLNCHGAHNASQAQPVADPNNTALPWTGSDNAFCLECHDGGAGPGAPGFPSGVVGPLLTGIDNCNYDVAPWWTIYSWTNSAHGTDSKRGWAGYVQDPQVPAYELDCKACHDPHGSYSPTNTAGNPHMIRDFVDGTSFVDDGSIGTVGTQYGWDVVAGDWEQYGTEGEVVIDIKSTGPDLESLCVKCHSDWRNASASHQGICGSNQPCLFCHSHGGSYDGYDWEYNGSDTPCP